MFDKLTNNSNKRFRCKHFCVYYRKTESILSSTCNFVFKELPHLDMIFFLRNKFYFLGSATTAVKVSVGSEESLSDFYFAQYFLFLLCREFIHRKARVWLIQSAFIVIWRKGLSSFTWAQNTAIIHERCTSSQFLLKQHILLHHLDFEWCSLHEALKKLLK